jgi:formylglycine-generating enzyme required for sulfatase activity
LLAFILERLYLEYGGAGNLKLSQYRQIGGIRGSIEAAIERAFNAADADPKIPKDKTARLTLLRRGLIPWIAGIDPDTGAPRRRVARMSEIPAEAVPLIQLLVDQRLLSNDVTKAGASTIEAAHEALLRQWGWLQQWLKEDTALLIVMDGVKRAAQEWENNEKGPDWLTHAAERLKAAMQLIERPDLAANLEPRDREYLATCREAEAAARRRTRRAQVLVGMLVAMMMAGLAAWVEHDDLQQGWRWLTVTRPYREAQVRPYVLTAQAERMLKPNDTFRECTPERAKDYCPELIVVPAGSFMMGPPPTGPHTKDEQQHPVTVANRFAVAKFDVTFDEWDACVAYGDCASGVGDSGWGRGRQPVISVTWEDAQQYVAWLSRMTGQTYRLLTESEWEYAARAGSTTAYYWGDEIGRENANCGGCGSQWDNKRAAPVGSFPANAFGLYDMAGNVWQWLQDCYHDDYDGAPRDGSAWTDGDCSRRVVRGGSWDVDPQYVSSSARSRGTAGNRTSNLGFRVGRTLTP